MAMEIPTLKEYFDNIVEVKDAPLRDQCTMECEFCNCTRSLKLQENPWLTNFIEEKEAQCYLVTSALTLNVYNLTC